MKPGKVQSKKSVAAKTARGKTPATKTPGAYKAGPKGKYIYPLWELGRVAAGGVPGEARYYADTRAAVVEGTRLQVGLAFEKRGCGSAPHSHPNEQFNLILQGAVRVKIGDLDEMTVPKGSVVHFPANVVHSQVALPDEDVIFYVVKDLSYGIVGIPATRQLPAKPKKVSKRPRTR